MPTADDFHREPPPVHRRAEPIVSRFSLKSILLGTLAASLGAAAFSAGYYLTAIVAVALTIAAFIAFAPRPPGSERRRTWWRWLLTLIAGSVWGAVGGLLLGAVGWFARPAVFGSWNTIYLLASCGAVLGLLLARPITGLFSTVFRWLGVFLPP